MVQVIPHSYGQSPAHSYGYEGLPGRYCMIVSIIQIITQHGIFH